MSCSEGGQQLVHLDAITGGKQQVYVASIVLSLTGQCM
jgi:hypothetical protein